MAMYFSQALESRRHDISRLLMVGMLIAVPFAVLWGYWFCTASIPVYETSRQFRISEKELTRKFFPRTGNGGMRTQSLRTRKILAVFSTEAVKKIARHQKGYFFPNTGHTKQTGAVPLTVTQVVPVSYEGNNRVTLRAEYPVDRADPFADTTEGEVCIAVGETTPLKFLAQLSGLIEENTLSVAFLSQRTAQ
jgi:hypothetical protein